MKLTKTLMDEHRLIERVISALEAASKCLDSGRNASPEAFGQAADFIRNFADGFHHAKEEDILFKAMVANGMPEKESPIEVMLIEHEQGREFVKKMLVAIGDLKSGRPEAAREIIRNARGYAELLREHIGKEDNILYPLAEVAFTDAKKAGLLREFKKAESKKGGAATVRKYREIVERLEKLECCRAYAKAAVQPAQ